MIDLNNLEKSFNRMPVLKGINLHIEPSKVTAILGPNASGKTTLIKSILGLVKPDAGQIMVKGKPLNGDWEYRSEIGYMPQQARFPDNLTPREIIRFISDLRGKSVQQDHELIHNFHLETELDKSFRTLSGGTRQKISAVITFLFQPEILILDEPTAGLDPVASRNLKNKIKKEKERGKTVLLTSHIMSEVEEMADDIIFLLEGKIHFEGAIHRILEDSRESKLESAIARLLAE